MPDAKDVILKHIAAVNDRDSSADPWAADAELVAPGGQASGRDDVISFLGVFTEAFPDLRLEIKQLLTDGPAAAAEGTLVGTHDGVLHTPNGDVAPTRRAVGLLSRPARSPPRLADAARPRQDADEAHRKGHHRLRPRAEVHTASSPADRTA